MIGMRILLVEDSHSLRQIFSTYLTQRGCRVDSVGSLEGARRSLGMFKPEAVIVDLSLGDGQGFDLLPDLAAREISALVVSSRPDSTDRVRAFELGAEDFMVKPADLHELYLRLARVRRARTRTTSRAAPAHLTCGNARIDIATRTVRSADQRFVSLTGSEFRLLNLLIEKRGAVVDRNTISTAVLNHRYVEHSRAVDVMVSKLRVKLAKVGEASAIRNVRAEGYVFEAASTSSSTFGP